MFNPMLNKAVQAATLNPLQTKGTKKDTPPLKKKEPLKKNY
jgi:hypothetical protein